MGRRLTTDEFVEQARAVHGHRYDYSMVDYVQRSTPVTVVCREHGPFETPPWRHVSRREGCSLCADIAAQDALHAAEERWVERARGVHGDRYKYPAPGYRGTGYRVKIVCPEHGLFEQFAANHLQGRGCQQCGRERAAEKRRGSDGGTYTTEEWIERAIDVHGDRYDYGGVVYHDSKTKVTIVCEVHGPFQQIPTQHLVGFGCAACAREPRLSQEDFVRRARATHGDKYDYSQAIFRGVRELVRIICRQHGPFDQNAGSHMSHTGCPDCGMERTRLDTEEFVAHAREIHGDRYDYAKSGYVTARTKLASIAESTGRSCNVRCITCRELVARSAPCLGR